MAIGLMTLFHDSGTPYHMNVWVIVTVTALIGGFWAFAVGKSVAARRAPVTVGPEQIIGLEGVDPRAGTSSSAASSGAPGRRSRSTKATAWRSMRSTA